MTTTVNPATAAPGVTHPAVTRAAEEAGGVRPPRTGGGGGANASTADPRSTMGDGRYGLGVDWAASFAGAPFAWDTFDPDHPTTPRATNMFRRGGQAGAGDFTGSVSGALVLRGRYIVRAGDFHFGYEPNGGMSLSVNTAMGSDGRISANDVLALAAGLDLIHYGTGRVDLHMLNVNGGLGWDFESGHVSASVAVSPFGIEYHMLDNLSGMITLPFTLTDDTSNGQTSVVFGPTFTMTYNETQGGRPGH